MTNPVLLLMLGICLALLASWQAGRRLMRARSQRLLEQFEDSTTSGAIVEDRPSAAGFTAALIPPPDPFEGCIVSYRTDAEYNPLAWPLQLFSPAPERLVVGAPLPERPSAELIWIRGRAPATALSRLADPELWTLRRLDFVDAEYATRGDNTNGVQHVFGELQTRYGPYLARVVVDAAADPHLIVTLDTARLDPAQIPTLMSLVQSLGRAALIG